jgi:SAM-dependent methyltransferase
MLKKAALKVFSDALEMLSKYPDFQDKIDEYASRQVLRKAKHFQRLLEGLDAERLDPFFSALRRRLWNSPAWNFGPRRLNHLLKEFEARAWPHIRRRDGVFFDLGCGKHNPMGMALVLYLNGASHGHCLDRDRIDRERAAEAADDLLVDILREPGAWLLAGGDPEAFRRRLAATPFHGPGARLGERYPAPVPVQLHNVALEAARIPDGSIDVLSSNSVVQYFDAFPENMRLLHAKLAPGGMAYHMVDFRDHRHYRTAMPHGFWHFLTQDATDENRQDLGIFTNMLRFSEIKNGLVEAGFEVLASCPVTRRELPPEVRAHLGARFRAMSQADLEILDGWFLARKA